MNERLKLPDRPVRLFRLSRWTSDKIQWEHFNDHLEAAADGLGATLSATPSAETASEPLGDADRQTVRDAFDRLRAEFERVLQPLQWRNRQFMNLVTLAIGATFIGACLSFVFPVSGAALSIASLASLVALLRTVWRLERDRAMLSLLPARYQLAVELCGSREEARTLLRLMIEESWSIKN